MDASAARGIARIGEEMMGERHPKPLPSNVVPLRASS